MTDCPYCEAASDREAELGLPGPDRLCALKSGEFNSDNRACGAMQNLKLHVLKAGVCLSHEPSRVYRLRMDDGWMIISWPSSWRERDPIRLCLVTSEEGPRQATAEEILGVLKEAGVEA